MALLKLEKVWYRYPGSRDYVLKNISLEFSGSRVYVVTGPNGAGKSTLLLVAAGLLKPCRGSVYYMGKPLHELIPGIRREFGLLFQNPETMLFNPIVYDEIAYALRQIYSDHRVVDRFVRESLDKVGLDPSILERPTHMLSYGEKKLVALASIIAYRPRILLLDEPYTSLSIDYTHRINELIKRFRDNGCLVIIVSHDIGYVEELYDHIIYMEKGSIKEFE